jgi:hypothetical protein
MIKRLIVWSFFLLTIFRAEAQDSLHARILLIGDAGQLTNGVHPVVAAAQKLVPMDKKTTVVYLGDNLYKTGLPDNSLPNYAIAKAPLDSQIRITSNPDVKIYFIPGNHDWANGGTNGYESILRVQSYIDLLGSKNVIMLPRDGCPGPVEVSITKDITLLILDSQWWLHEKEKPGIESDCPYKTKEEILVQLDDILAKNEDKLVILATHHPFRSYGQHGGYFTLKQHIFPFTDAVKNLYIPLPVIGSIYPLTRAVFGTTQDLKHPLYQEMISDIESVVKGHKNVIYVSGHDHTMQMIQDSGYNYIVSGSGSKTSRVSKSRHTLFASSQNGFVVLDVMKNKNASVHFYEVKPDTTTEAYTGNIFQFAKKPLEAPDTVRKVEYAFKDSVVISASDQYKHSTAFQRFLLGNNYRKEWSTPVSFKVFNLKKEKGGFKIESLGGGKQTKSLKLTDKQGNEWALRSVEKDPEKALPDNLRGTIAQWVVADMISASHPYAPLTIHKLSRAVGVPGADPEFFFVPDDPALGYYRPLFANTVCMLEPRSPDVLDKDPKSTNKIMNKMYEDNDHHVDQEKTLNARLLDMIIGDFDRHNDQWKWGTDDTGKGKLYYPIPRDRDQAYFNSDGLAIKYLSKEHMRFLQGFKPGFRDINGLNYVARNFDRLFLNHLDAKDWERITKDFQNNLKDTVIKDAVAELPAPIRALDAGKIENSLIVRRDKLMPAAMKYYRFLSKTVSVAGSNKAEYFHITPSDKGFELTVYKKNEETDSATVMYHRIFLDKETKEVRLFGLNDADKFDVDEAVHSKIKLRIIGGKGNDTFNIRGNVRNFVYDLSTEKNVSLALRRTNKEFSSDPLINDYRNNGFEYNRFMFPVINLGFNPEDKLLLGVGFLKRTYGFRNEPYATLQKLNTLYAPGYGAYQIKYQGVFNKVISKNDLLANVEWINPTLNNFFGYGNESIYDKSKPLSYYRVRTNSFTTELLVRKRLKEFLSVSLGPVYQHYKADFEKNKDRILSNPAIIGKDSFTVYSPKDYAGGKLRLDINYVNSEIYPTRGITWFSDLTMLKGLNENSRSLTKVNTDMTIYAQISDKSRLAGIFRLGYGHIFSKDFEFFQAMNIGANNYIRGYRKNRFSGRTMAYGSSELRFRIARVKSYLVPGDFGVLAYYDIGRVWMNNERSRQFHDAFGAGFYYVPYSLISFTASIGISNESSLVNISLGTKFNINF